MEYGKLRTVSCRNMKSGLSHEGQQADGFQRDRLTTGVWSGNNKLTEIFAEPYINRYDFFCIQQRMASFADMDAPLFIEDRCNTVVGFGELCFGKDEIQLGKHGIILTDAVCIFSDAVGQIGEDHIDLILFF